jgi:hypothetical protein
MTKKIIVKKLQSSDEEDATSTEDFTSTDDSNSTYQRKEYNSIVNSRYTRQSKQDNMSEDVIRQRLQGFVPLTTIRDKKILTTLPLFKTWIRYINTNTGQFRVGGLLMKVEYPDYIMLVNNDKNLTWSVQLKDNMIFIRDPSRKEQVKKEQSVKNKLYQMYKNGELKRK